MRLLVVATRLVLTALALVGVCLPSPARAQTLRRPFACDTCIANWFYFDEDAGGGAQDWSCASSSYDGHRGSDFSLRGGNGAIDAGHDVVAAAAGDVVSVQDGHADRCTSCGGSGCGLGFGGGFGNHVVINHGSYRVVYAHMRTGSVRVTVGDRVTCGQVVGQIGSSGCSSGAHLHFETRPLGGATATAFDPFAGACSPRSPSLWTSQGGHRSIPGAECDGPPVCPGGTFAIWTCNAASTQRRRCIAGVDTTEDCRWGCVGMPVGTDDVCGPAPDADGDGAAADVDCDDGNAAIRPGASDPCGDGIDQDCAGGDPVCDVDGGIVRGDAASTELDAATALDGGRRDGGGLAVDAGGDRVLSGGCGCRAGAPSGDGAGMLAVGVALLAWIRRRR